MGQAFSAVAHTVGDSCCEQDGHEIFSTIDIGTAKGSAYRSDRANYNSIADVFTITLTRMGNTKLGLDLDFVPTREAMPVRAITGDLVEEWNREHPRSQVLPGDRIVEVNGTRGVADQMMKALAESDVVKITLVRMKVSKGVDDWEYTRAWTDRIEFEESTPTAIYELVPYQGDHAISAGAGISFGDAVTGQIKSTATVIPWGGQIGSMAMQQQANRQVHISQDAAAEPVRASSSATAHYKQTLEPQATAVLFRDPRPGARGKSTGLVGFGSLHGPAEAWDRLCKAGFLGNGFDTGPGGLELEAPAQEGIRHQFRTSEAAIQALRFWSIAEEFSDLGGAAAVKKSKQLQGREDVSYAGFGSSWKAMQAVLAAKFFKDTSPLTEALRKTGDAFLLHHQNRPGQDKVWADDCSGEGTNWLGLQLLLLRDQLSGEKRWTEYISSLIDIDSGRPRSGRKGQQWQATVRAATRSLLLEVARAPSASDQAQGSEGSGGSSDHESGFQDVGFDDFRANYQDRAPVDSLDIPSEGALASDRPGGVLGGRWT